MIITDKKYLRQKSIDITEDDAIDNIVKQLKENNETAWTKGCGLAGIQIGINKRIAWLKINDEELILINPEITKYGESRSIELEGCLSIPNTLTKVRRSDYIEIVTNSFTQEKKHYSGFIAKVIQHEIDHMNGILNIDKKYKQYNKTKRKKK